MEFDAIVIGGGPAGALTARGLARLGWSTVLIERGPRNRNKTCGHCLSRRAIHLLEQAGLAKIVSTIATGAIDHLRVHSSSGGELMTQLADDLDDCSSPDSGVLAPRDVFDQALIDAAAAEGVSVMQSTSARMAMDDACAVDVRSKSGEVRLHANLIIGADGVGSSVARATGLAQGGSIGRKYGFSFDLRDADLPAVSDGAIDMFVVPGGYLGIVHQNDGRIHCAGLVSAATKTSARNPMQFVRCLASQFDALQRLGLEEITQASVDRFSAIGPMPWRPRRIANHRAALVGDAAGYIEPFTGEGMTWAIQSASVLLESIAQSRPGLWNAKMASQYERRWAQSIAPRQRACRAVAFALSRPQLFEMALHAGRWQPALPRRLAQWVNA